MQHWVLLFVIVVLTRWTAKNAVPCCPPESGRGEPAGRMCEQRDIMIGLYPEAFYIG